MPTIVEAEIRRSMVQGEPEKNRSQEPISTNMSGVVECTRNPSYLGDIERKQNRTGNVAQKVACLPFCASMLMKALYNDKDTEKIEQYGVIS
jgi:hypothetical protein